ncbi:hypothetical protein LWM68_41260 [Niabella sp. W65]|nr:hypothetical protein [Niabella sp. W65]MCH7368602.1 hypothetical protein [Niabella sp. W65]ULT44190.1 hypothetical protein KRR40_12965 [Niabella sp. I65]
MQSIIGKLLVDFKQTPGENSYLRGLISDAAQLADAIEITKRNIGEVAFSPRGLDMPSINPKIGSDVAEKALSWAQQVKAAAAKGITQVFQNGIMVPLSVSVDPEALKRTEAAAIATANAVNSAVKSMAQNAAFSLGESIGNMITGDGGVAELLNGLLNVIGDAFKAFGKEMIAIGTTMLLVDTGLKALKIHPALTVAAGIASVALGEVLQGDLIKSKNKSFRAFADGGVVYGPTNALIGEYAGASSNPEVVAPLDRLKDIIGGGNNVNITGEFVMRGRDMAVVLERETKYRNR